MTIQAGIVIAFLACIAAGLAFFMRPPKKHGCGRCPRYGKGCKDCVNSR